VFKMSDVKVPGGVLSFDVETLEELFQRASLIQSMPAVCPIDGSDTCLNYMEIDDNPYYSVRSVQNPQYSYKYGRKKAGGALFPKGWYEYDPVNKCQWFWRDGQWYAVSSEDSTPLFDKPRPVSKQSPSTLAGNGKQDYEKRVEVAGRDALDEAIDAAFGGEDEPIDQNGPRLGNATKGQLGTMHALGIALYGDARTWDIKRPVVTKHISQGRVESSAMLTQVEVSRLIFNLEAKIREHYDLLADKCLRHGVTIENVDPDELSGVPLAHSYTAATKAFKDRQGERVAA
jgi:hypothetical protein